MKCWLALELFLVSGPLFAKDGPAQPALFSAAAPGPTLPPEWSFTPLPNVPRATHFDLVRDSGRTVLRAVAENAAATLIHKLHLDTSRTPWLSWSWKVSRVLEGADLTRKDGDDYAARIYVLFDYDPQRLSLAERTRMQLARSFYGQELPTAALCYVWDNSHPVGTRAWSAYTDRVRMIVAQSGSAQAGRWIEEQRDVAADFREAFGEDPPPVSGIAVTADTDNTGESVTAYFGDVSFLASPKDGTVLLSNP